MRRTQIYLDDQQHESLATLARQRGVTASAVIRDAIDQYVSQQRSPREKLAELRALGARFATADRAGAETANLGAGNLDTENADAADTATTVDKLRSADADRLHSPA